MKSTDLLLGYFLVAPDTQDCLYPMKLDRKALNMPKGTNNQAIQISGISFKYWQTK